MNPLSGYIELELCGEILPFKFGTNAWSLFCEKRKIEFFDIFKSGVFGKFSKNKKGEDEFTTVPDVFALMDLYYFAYITAIRIKKEEVKISFEDFCERMNEDPEATIKLQNVMLASRFMGYTLPELIEKVAGEGDKTNFPKT